MTQLLTTPEVCERLRLSRAMVYRLIDARRIRPVRIGRALRFDPDDLAAFIDSAKAAPDPDASGPRAGVGRAA